MFNKLKDHLVPHEGNNHSPYLFAAESMGTFLLIVMLFQVVFVAHTAVVKNSSFLAAVLPTVLVTMTNVDRVEAGVSELESDALLAKAAQLKADDMAQQGYFAHRDPQGRDPWYWFDTVGYEYSYAGENLAIDFSESVAVEEAWMASPAHKANIIKGKFTKVGIGVATGTYEGRETTFVVQFFAHPASLAPAPAPALTPIVAVVEPEALSEPVTVTEPVEVLPAEEPIVVAIEDVVAEGTDPRVLGRAFEPIIDDNETTILIDEQVQSPSFVVTETRGEARDMKSVAQEKFIELASSPSLWYMPLLVTLFTILGVVLIVALRVHVGRREVEGIAMAMSALVLLAGLVHFNFGSDSMSALVPSDTQSASVSMSFESGFYYQE